MKSQKHLIIAAWIFIVFSLLSMLPGISILVMISLDAALFLSGPSYDKGLSWLLLFMGVYSVIMSLFYFRLTVVYFRTAAGKLLVPPRWVVFFVMIFGFPYGTAAGAYALYARHKHIRHLEEAEPEPEAYADKPGRLGNRSVQREMTEFC